MALWAMWMFFAAALTTVISGIGLYLIGRTLVYTRNAALHTSEMAIEAKKTTLAAQAASVAAENQVTQSAAQFEAERVARERENMPAVLVVDATYRDLTDTSGEISLTLENVGRQAAIDVYVLSREKHFMPEGQYYEERVSLSYAAQWLPRITKAGKRRAGAIGVNPRRITIPIHFRVDQMRNCVITEGAVIYSDAGGKDYISQFFYWLSSSDARMETPVPMQSGTLRMATFKPYDGPELRDREGY